MKASRPLPATILAIIGFSSSNNQPVVRRRWPAIVCTGVALAAKIVGSVVSASAQMLPLGDEFLVNANREGSRRNPVVASNALDGFIVVWEEHMSVPPYSEIVGRLYDGSGVPIGTQFQVTDEDRGSYPSVAMGEDGTAIVVWNADDLFDEPKVRARTFDVDGAPLSDALGVDTTIFQGDCCPRGEGDRKGGSDVSALPGGQFIVVWSGGYNYVYEQAQHPGFRRSHQEKLGQIVNRDGTLEGAELDVGGSEQWDLGDLDVAADAQGSFVVAWGGVTGYSYRYDQYDRVWYRSAHRVARAECVAPDGTGISGSLSAGESNFRGAKVASQSSGDFLLTWSDESAMRAQRYDALGNPLGARLTVSASAPGWFPGQGGFAAATAPGGSFVLVWTEGFPGLGSPDGSDMGIVAREYSSEGAARTPPVLVNVGTTGIQTSPSVAFTRPDEFVVTWVSYADGRDVIARRFARTPSCGDVDADGSNTATDALTTLAAAVGLSECEACLCDVDGFFGISASDALRILRRTVDESVSLACASC